jgi:hypothetical protein
MSGAVCPCWLGYFIVAPWRRLWQDPRALLRRFLTEGTRVLEPGPGMGFFTLEMARLVDRLAISMSRSATLARKN